MRFNTAAACGLAVMAFAAHQPAVAKATDYKFEVTSAKHAGPGITEVTVRLVHTPESKSVADAVIFETRADMGPEGMPTMPGEVTAGTRGPGGAYRFQVATAMAGNWALTLSAKVQGEAETVKQTITFKAVK